MPLLVVDALAHRDAASGPPTRILVSIMARPDCGQLFSAGHLLAGRRRLVCARSAGAAMAGITVVFLGGWA